MQNQSFRDHLSTIDETDKKRKWIYPRITKGTLYRYRSGLGLFLLALLFAGPFIRIGNQPLLLLNVLERKFVILGIAFWPQDLYLFALAMLTFIVFIVVFTVVFGRVWCGWACPQTIFMEMVFRRIENWIEGDHIKQQKLDKSPWTTEKVIKKTAKHTIFVIISFLISNIFLAYIIGSEGLIKIIKEPIEQHLSGFIAICIFTGVFYMVFARMRELVCIIACPYGRLQGVLLDNNSMVVAYDHQRGEPRGKIRKDEVRSTGDCIDCKLCVQVCPTGIDIRNGTQLECINCTACIDACDEVMVKIDKPTRLIGFFSEDGIKTRSKFKFGPRVVSYSIILLLLMSVTGYLLASRKPMELTLLKAPGTLYQEQGDNISNLFNFELVNKTDKEMPLKIETDVPGAKIQVIGQNSLLVAKESMIKGTMFIIIPKKQITEYSTKVRIRFVSNGKTVMETEASFMAPFQ